MNFSVIKKALLGLGLFFMASGLAWAQNPGLDSVLPPDHLLENLPWLGEDGKTTSKGLFDFEDVRGLGQKDLILIYRQSAPVNELDKPHNQTLIVCFYDTTQQKYIKNFEDEGGPIQWVKLVKDTDRKNPFLIIQRDDLKGNQVLKGYTFLDGALKEVLDAQAVQIFAKFNTGFQGTEIWVSSKEIPKDKDSAERAFAWDESKNQFAEAKPSSATGWTGSSIAVPTPVVEAKVSKGTSDAPTGAVKASHPSKNGWWDEPLDPEASSGKLNTELVPQYIKKGDIATLGQKAKAFFAELQKKNVDTKKIASLRSGYYTAVASSELDLGNSKDAAYYLKTALQLQADNPDALALKAKLKP